MSIICLLPIYKILLRSNFNLGLRDISMVLTPLVMFLEIENRIPLSPIPLSFGPNIRTMTSFLSFFNN